MAINEAGRGGLFWGGAGGRKDSPMRPIESAREARISRLLRILGEEGSWDQSYQEMSLENESG